MEKYLYIIVISMLAVFGFSSCSDDESFYKGDAAREALKHKWNVSSIEVKTNDGQKDEIPNFILKTFLLNTKQYAETFDGQQLKTVVEAKDPALFEPIQLSERYVVMDDNLYVESQLLGNQNIPYTFKVSDKTLIVQFKFNKQMFEQILQLIGTNIDPAIQAQIEAFLADLPDDFSGEIIKKLKR
ncbi:hypothetical protein [Dysgonomonas sp. 520]|uniref:hypothetical protein n=1 Tax=Dysgonomonas sp. 520 TaxID=2302931 RepID=UPI0013D483E2|nr:hypothetical protein [Dysgonomonas sp. 520]